MGSRICPSFPLLSLRARRLVRSLRGGGVVAIARRHFERRRGGSCPPQTCVHLLREPLRAPTHHQHHAAKTPKRLSAHASFRV